MTKAQIEAEIKNITEQIVKKYKPEKIILFGSAARGEFTEDSDLDFLIIKNQVPKSSIHRRWQLRYLLDESSPVDLLILKPGEFKNRLKKNDPFFTTIIQEGVVLYDQ